MNLHDESALLPMLVLEETVGNTNQYRQRNAIPLIQFIRLLTLCAMNVART